ncbi:hypothetical protein LTR91_004345 [Friedmanniomyces endolithicus]|uniref:DNA polymerase kappa n=1 Tax=Friedmanniomyces endolithicus TaxID=329885 RepID=A0AAN6KV67_9PEZI|nr:hypothetical protein LTR57_007648 [Friedmanniomyces endolithicus]KAK1004268.1 hypothetical protein LTR91_004345 [Friedmanniomyces endolithicus]KAK1038743.1 hypothetical protein LTS16_011737 [Friedmanniomyces endolithicus]
MPRHNDDLATEAEAAVAPAASTTSALPDASQHHTLKYHLLGPSLTKSGQDGVDQSKVSEIIYNASKGSKYFTNEENKDKSLTAKIQRILAKKRELQSIEAQGGLKNELKAAETCIEELEYGRDVSQTIVHIDCDAFYAAVEELDRPELKDVPFAVGMGVLTTCNYHARKFGCRSGMAGFVADKLCPGLIHLPLNFEKYTAKAREVRTVLEQYDPRFESASMDEAYLNITTYCQEHQLSPEDAVSQLRAQVHAHAKITISAGIAANARIAKICSNKNKPNGQFLVPSDRASILAFMRDLQTRKVNGIGRVFERELDAIGVKTCGDIYAQRMYLSRLFGEKAFNFLMSVHLGLGRTDVRPAEEFERKSVGTESTFHDLSSPAELREKLRWTAEELEKDLLRTGFRGRTLVLKIKLHSYEVLSRQVQPPRAVGTKEELYRFAEPMLEKLEREMDGMKLRLMGLRCTHLVSTKKGEVDFFGRVRRRVSEQGAEVDGQERGGVGVDEDGWQKWPTGDEEFEDAARQERQEEAEETERLSQQYEQQEDEEQDPPPSAQRQTSKYDPDGAPSDYRRYGNGFAWRSILEEEAAAAAAERAAEEAAKEPVGREQWDCPICGVPQAAEEKGFNAHIDGCLSRRTIKEIVRSTDEVPENKTSMAVPASTAKRKRGRPTIKDGNANHTCPSCAPLGQDAAENKTPVFALAPAIEHAVNMPTALQNPTQDAQNTILTPLIDAHLNGHLGNDVLDFAKILFGTAATEQAMTEGKEERREALPANGALVMMVCRSLMRAYVSLRKQGEEANAEKLRAIADKHYSRETVDAEMVEVIMGR